MGKGGLRHDDRVYNNMLISDRRSLGIPWHQEVRKGYSFPGHRFNPGRGTKILQAAWYGQKKKRSSLGEQKEHSLGIGDQDRI